MINRTEFKFGIRMTREEGVSIYGVEEVQQALEDGGVIISLKADGAHFVKTGERDGYVSFYFSGGSFTVVVEMLMVES